MKPQEIKAQTRQKNTTWPLRKNPTSIETWRHLKAGPLELWIGEHPPPPPILAKLDTKHQCMCVPCIKGKRLSDGKPKVWLHIVIVLSCPLIDCWATERASQRAAQNNYYIEPVWGFVLFKLCYLYWLPLQIFSPTAGSERSTRSQTANKVPFHQFEDEGYLRDDMVFNYSLADSKTESD